MEEHIPHIVELILQHFYNLKNQKDQRWYHHNESKTKFNI